MKQQTRELLVTTKVAQHWQGDFDQKVDELMTIISKIDNEQQVIESCELLDVYQKTRQKLKKSGKKKKPTDYFDKPFEFLVFRN
jgi:exonuclease VII small subunit